MRYTWGLYYPRGRMNIYADEFFPCPKKDLKILLNTLDSNRDYPMQYESGRRLKEYLEDRIREAEDPTELKTLANDATSNRTKASEMQELIDRQVKQVGSINVLLKGMSGEEKKRGLELLKSERERLKDLKGTQRFLRSVARNQESSFNKRKKDAVKLKANLELLQEYLKVWK